MISGPGQGWEGQVGHPGEHDGGKTTSSWGVPGWKSPCHLCSGQWGQSLVRDLSLEGLLFVCFVRVGIVLDTPKSVILGLGPSQPGPEKRS